MTYPQHKRPIWMGLIVASFFPMLWFIVQPNGFLFPTSLVELKVVASLYGALYITSLLGIVLLGLPLVLLLKWAERLTWFNVIVVSVVSGSFYYQVLGIFFSDGFQPRYLQEGFLFGLLAGIGFCIGAWPNKSFKADAVNGAA